MASRIRTWFSASFFFPDSCFRCSKATREGEEKRVKCVGAPFHPLSGDSSFILEGNGAFRLCGEANGGRGGVHGCFLSTTSASRTLERKEKRGRGKKKETTSIREQK